MNKNTISTSILSDYGNIFIPTSIYKYLTAYLNFYKVSLFIILVMDLLVLTHWQESKHILLILLPLKKISCTENLLETFQTTRQQHTRPFTTWNAFRWFWRHSEGFKQTATALSVVWCTTTAHLPICKCSTVRLLWPVLVKMSQLTFKDWHIAINVSLNRLSSF